MCVQIIADADADRPVWDRDEVTIRVSPRLSRSQALVQVRAMLIRLGGAQPGPGATCWCGDPVAVPDLPMVPRQRSAAREGAHGAA